MIVDAHLDLAYNAMMGRDLTLGLAELRESDPVSDVATVSFGTLRRGNVGLCFGTLFVAPRDAEHPWGFENQQGARTLALKQLDQYLRWQDAGHVRLLTTADEVKEHAARWSPETSPLGVVLLMEGADPLKSADDLPFWAERGVRLLGPTWVHRNAFAGGNAEPGPLSGRGEELMLAMRELNVALDASHLSEESFWRAIELQPKVIATHSNARAVVNTERHLSDEMLGAIKEREGMVGTVLYNKFLRPSWQRGDARPPLEVVGEMMARLADVVGWPRVGLGSDLDGGFGVPELPRGLESAADLPKIGNVVPDKDRDGVLGGNWLRWLEGNL